MASGREFFWARPFFWAFWDLPDSGLAPWGSDSNKRGTANQTTKECSSFSTGYAGICHMDPIPNWILRPKRGTMEVKIGGISKMRLPLVVVTVLCISSTTAIAAKMPSSTIDAIGMNWRPPVAPADFDPFPLPALDFSAWTTIDMGTDPLEFYFKLEGANAIAAMLWLPYVIVTEDYDNPLFNSLGIGINTTAPSTFLGIEMGPLFNAEAFGIGLGGDATIRTIPTYRGDALQGFFLGADLGVNLFVPFALNDEMSLELGMRGAYGGASDSNTDGAVWLLDSHLYFRHEVLPDFSFSDQGAGYLIGVGTQTFIAENYEFGCTDCFSRTHLDLRAGITF
jgi:hypothetical protein